MLHYQKDLNVEASYDVVVAGCGASGVCAAVAAARRGCKVAVIERFGAVGGNLTLGGVGPMMGEVAKAQCAMRSADSCVWHRIICMLPMVTYTICRRQNAF